MSEKILRIVAKECIQREDVIAREATLSHALYTVRTISVNSPTSRGMCSIVGVFTSDAGLTRILSTNCALAYSSLVRANERLRVKNWDQ